VHEASASGGNDDDWAWSSPRTRCLHLSRWRERSAHVSAPGEGGAWKYGARASDSCRHPEHFSPTRIAHPTATLTRRFAAASPRGRGGKM